MKKLNPWTCGLVALGLVSVTSAAQADDNPTPLLTSDSSTVLSGYVDTSAQWNLGTGNVNAPLYSFGGTSKADGFNLNVVDLNLEKGADVSDSWGTGYRVELWLGPDADALGTQSTSALSTSDFAIKNAYVELKTPLGNGIDWKIGVWDTVIGYEAANSPSNPNFTRSYGFTLEPTTHTGILASYAVNDMIAMSAGVADTFGPVINERATGSSGGVDAESYKAYMGSVTLTAPKQFGWAAGSTLSGAVINGFNVTSPATDDSGNGNADQTSFYAGLSLNTPLKALKVGLSYDYVMVGNEPKFGVTRAYANATGLYATYQVNDNFSLNARGEYFSQSKNNRVAGLPTRVIEGTLTAQYDLWKNVLSRVEFRWDHQADGTGRAYGSAGSDPILGGSLRNSYELIANIAYKF